MKLYYAPGACSLAPHMALRETGLEFELEQVDLTNRKTASGEDFTRINPLGYVPCLRRDDGETLTECAVLLQWIADQSPELGLAPPEGSPERYRLQEILNFVATELHKGFGPLFNPAFPDAAKQVVLENLKGRLGYLDARLADRTFLLGDRFSVADCYLATVLGWTRFLKMDLSPWPNLGAYLGRIMARPAVQEALKAEGLRT